MNKTVYVAVAGDEVRAGHIDMIAEGRKQGGVIIGLLTDRAISRFSQLPALEFHERKRVFENIVGVSRVVEQDDWDLLPNLHEIKPDFVLCDDDFQHRLPRGARERAEAALTAWGGRLLDRAPGQPTNAPTLERRAHPAVTPGIRRRSLLRLLNTREMVRAIEVHSPLCGQLVEHLQIDLPDRTSRFHAMWSSSLTDSTARGKPDIDVVDISTRLAAVDQLFEVTSKPLIFDGNDGGHPEHFAYTVRSLERLGVSAVIVEDKTGLKRNSLLDGAPQQDQETIDRFCEKIAVGRAAAVTDAFIIVGRVESLILGAGMEDALTRAHAYVAAGADGIMIHSRSKSPEEVLEFCDRFRSDDSDTALVAVPSSYSSVHEDELRRRGVNVVIYANHLLRAAYPAMRAAAESILRHGRAKEADSLCMPISELLDLVPGTR